MSCPPFSPGIAANPVPGGACCPWTRFSQLPDATIVKTPKQIVAVSPVRAVIMGLRAVVPDGHRPYAPPPSRSTSTSCSLVPSEGTHADSRWKTAGTHAGPDPLLRHLERRCTTEHRLRKARTADGQGRRQVVRAHGWARARQHRRVSRQRWRLSRRLDVRADAPEDRRCGQSPQSAPHSLCREYAPARGSHCRERGDGHARCRDHLSRKHAEAYG